MNNETISLNGLDDSPIKTSLGQLVTHIYNLEEQVEHYKNECEEHEAHSDQLEKDVETLLAENEKLKEKDKGWTQLMKGAMTSGLVGKVERLEEDILYYRMYLYTVDRDASWSPAKDDVDSFTDDPQQRKTLYERIGYESDDDSD